MELFAFDDDYVRRLREGDRWTEEHFLSYFQQLLLIKLRRRLPSLQAIEDVRQEVFVRVFRTLRAPDGGLRDGRKLGAYVNTVCNNVLLEQYRQKNRTEPLLDVHLEVTTSEDVEQAMVGAQERERVRRVIGELPKRDADILQALFLDERSNDDVCHAFGVERGYLRVLLHRAKEKFRSAWTQNVVRIGSGETDSGKPSLPN
ncbi:MAG TPA: sigma-70 family RNA polymerase sigma factor [Thermoanaerobaculia bacterium]|nr:sigma-70 family RNA polymerase sigma factor [Thermoanaerobaculia bacterium]